MCFIEELIVMSRLLSLKLIDFDSDLYALSPLRSVGTDEKNSQPTAVFKADKCLECTQRWRGKEGD